MSKDRSDFEGKNDHDLLVILVTKFCDLTDQLCDNGQPGRCSIHDMRLRKLEYFKAWAKGAMWALGLVAMASLTLAGALLARKP